jgi:acyl-CoA synthetase (AMP-forming)/AMP-acid ligase II
MTSRLKGTSYQDIVTIWAISRAGYVPQLISIRMPNPVVVYELLKRAGAVALIADQNFESLLADSPFPVLYSVNVSSDGCEELPALEPLATPSDPKNIVMIFHTSGSTSGSPKLVPITTKWLDFAIEKMGQFQMPSSMVKQQTVVSG